MLCVLLTFCAVLFFRLYLRKAQRRLLLLPGASSLLPDNVLMMCVQFDIVKKKRIQFV